MKQNTFFRIFKYYLYNLSIYIVFIYNKGINIYLFFLMKKIHRFIFRDYSYILPVYKLTNFVLRSF